MGGMPHAAVHASVGWACQVVTHVTTTPVAIEVFLSQWGPATLTAIAARCRQAGACLLGKDEEAGSCQGCEGSDEVAAACSSEAAEEQAPTQHCYC